MTSTSANDRDPLLSSANPATARTYGMIPPMVASALDEESLQQQKLPPHMGLSQSLTTGKDRLLAAALSSSFHRGERSTRSSLEANDTKRSQKQNNKNTGSMRFVYYIIFALVWVLVFAPWKLWNCWIPCTLNSQP